MSGRNPDAPRFSEEHRARAAAAATREERARISAILAMKSAIAHPEAAAQAIELGLTPAQAQLVAKAAPLAPGARNTGVAAAMSALGNPRITALEAEELSPSEEIAAGWGRAFARADALSRAGASQ